MVFQIRNHSGIDNIEVFVSKYSNSNGSDEWYKVAPDFTSRSADTWNRTGWEVVVFKDPSTGKRRGWYLKGEGTLQLTFYGLDAELGLVKA
ncbi:hypothetical protein BKA70DRAFT_1116107 [Coprinopsis sp. MPI-PUGE-AT-0042]|nr:hypothetical protein BKA70DRAFT_1116107 [Coprinopsis sp. MPI-PUGE-AT-0042]